MIEEIERVKKSSRMKQRKRNSPPTFQQVTKSPSQQGKLVREIANPRESVTLSSFICLPFEMEGIASSSRSVPNTLPYPTHKRSAGVGCSNRRIGVGGSELGHKQRAVIFLGGVWYDEEWDEEADLVTDSHDTE